MARLLHSQIDAGHEGSQIANKIAATSSDRAPNAMPRQAPRWQHKQKHNDNDDADASTKSVGPRSFSVAPHQCFPSNNKDDRTKQKCERQTRIRPVLRTTEFNHGSFRHNLDTTNDRNKYSIISLPSRTKRYEDGVENVNGLVGRDESVSIEESEDETSSSPISQSQRIQQRYLKRSGLATVPSLAFVQTSVTIDLTEDYKDQALSPNTDTSWPPSPSNDGAILRFSPPRSRSPSKKTAPNLDSISWPQTPPISPSKKNRLISPSKSKIKLLPTPFRPSIDAFWDQDFASRWNEQFSPKKILRYPGGTNSPSESGSLSSSDAESDDDSPITQDPTSSPRDFNTKPKSTMPRKLPRHKTPRSPSDSPTKAQVKDFELHRQELATEFLQELDNVLCGGEVGRKTAATGGVKIVWSTTLNKTAGRAHWRRERISNDPKAIQTNTSCLTNEIQYRHHVSIDLATKVVTSQFRLLHVLTHEFCHLANYLISNVTKKPHGASFRSWGAKAEAAFADRGITVTTKHNFEIGYKYEWRCAGLREDRSGCGKAYQRHSKSINPLRQSCGRCKGRLVQVRPVPRNKKMPASNTENHASENVDSPKIGKAQQTSYQAFVSSHYKTIQKELGPASPMKVVMKELSSRYRAAKSVNDSLLDTTPAACAIDDVTQTFKAIEI